MAIAEAEIISAWTPPPVITGFSGTVVEEDSHILLSWTASSLTTEDFESYIIYRREVGVIAWTELVIITDKAQAEYNDYTAGQTLDYEYMILQYKTIIGDAPLASDESDIVTAGLEGDSWFLVQGSTLEAVELTITDEEHTTVLQQETFEPMAGTRKRIVRGLKLGDEGSFTAWFDTSEARVRKVFFEILAATPGPHILKSAFGDVWSVEYDAPGFKYLSGGHLEVEMGWVQV